MIISYKYGFIFVKTKKTASTAVEIGLSQICGPDDVISPFGAGQEVLRAGLGAAPRNFHPNKDLERRYVEAVRTGDRKAMRVVALENRTTGGCTGHMKARDIKSLVTEDFWNRAYKFTTERHPFEKAVSLAHFTFGSKVSRRMSFAEHLEHTVKVHYLTYSSARLYSIDGQPVMDGFLFQDVLAADLTRLRERLGLPEFEMPHARAHTRKDRRPAVEVLTRDQKEYIREKCAFEFELFGWQEDGSRIPPPQAAANVAGPPVRAEIDAEPQVLWANDRRLQRKARRPGKVANKKNMSASDRKKRRALRVHKEIVKGGLTYL